MDFLRSVLSREKWPVNLQVSSKAQGGFAQETRGDQSKQLTKVFTSLSNFMIVECCIPSYTAENSAFICLNSTSLKGC